MVKQWIINSVLCPYLCKISFFNNNSKDSCEILMFLFPCHSGG